MKALKCVIAPVLMGVLAVGASADTSAPVQSALTLERLRGNNGVTLQWISWDHRGPVSVRSVGGTTYLTASQIATDGAGTVWLDGKIVESGDDYFIFEGLIRIANTPDAGRICEQTKRWRFAITQNRQYYRMREFEWCDGLTDYIDIYF